MPNPFACFDEDRPEPPKKAAPPPPDYSEQKRVYAEYLQRVIELHKHAEYAMMVCKATDGPGRTPVKPLATMGTNGGPLLCDHCGKAIILESMPHYNVPADVA